MENIAIKHLIEFYKSYIKDKEEYIKLLEDGDGRFNVSHYFYQCGLLQAYSGMLEDFIEVLGGEDNGKD